MDHAPNAIQEIDMLCPECGRDVCTLCDTKRKWTHRSRLIPRVVWVLMCLGLIGYWVSIGDLHLVTSRSSSNTVMYFPNIDVGRKNPNTTLRSWRRAESDVSYVSTQDLRDAIAGDAKTMELVRANITLASVANSAIGNTSKIESVLFGWKEPSGSYTSNRSYHLGGLLWATHHSARIQDVRDPSSIGHGQYHGSLGEGGWSFFPQLGRKKIVDNGDVINSWYVNLINVFRMLSMCIACAWLVTFVGRRLGISLMKSRGFRLGLAGVFLLAAGLTSVLGVSVFQQTYGNYSQDIAQSNVYLVEQLSETIEDDSKLISICQDLLDLLLGWDKEELLLGQFRIYQQDSTSQKWAQSTTVHLVVSIAPGPPMLSYQNITYSDLSTGEKIPARRSFQIWKGLAERGQLILQWGPPENQRMARLGLFSLVSKTVLFWFICRISHSCAQYVLRLVQRRRVLQNQCIFCAYPLTQEATYARYPQVEP